jgi:hypothetical protein
LEEMRGTHDGIFEPLESVVGDFLKIVHQAVKQPLRVDLVFAAVGEPVHAFGCSDVAVLPTLALFTRFRQALGERRPLIEAPGHIVTVSDAEDAISIVATSLLFIWDCYGISTSGRDAFYISHDEYCYFASRDASTAERVASEIAAI